MSQVSEAIADWNDLAPKKKALFVVIVMVAIAIPVGNYFIQSKADLIKQNEEEMLKKREAPASKFKEIKEKGTIEYSPTMLPTTNRNQGLEDITLQVDNIAAAQRETSDKVDALIYEWKTANKKSVDNPVAVKPNPQEIPMSSAATLDLNTPLQAPPKVDFNEAPPPARLPQDNNMNESVIPPPQLKVWESSPTTSNASRLAPELPELTIPANSGLNGILLTGFNARQPAASIGAASSTVSAVNVGAPFVTKLKGDAMLPNGWKVSDLGECFVGGSAVAVLSTERANAIADKITCVKASGEIWEADMKAYAVDVDGTLGIAGHVVSKQGSLLLQATLAAMIGGVGEAFAPEPVQTYNIQTNGSSKQEYQLPDGRMIAGTSLGRGINAAGESIAKFYLEYAREIIPVVEVTSKTRVTWVLKENLTLRKVTDKG